MATIKLQSIGTQTAKRADELVVGDITVWNFGMKSEITEIIKITKKTILFGMKSLESDWVGTRRMNKDRLVGIKN